ncbi:MaoC/PaaZ C-terminal domain-containing protein [Thermodesulfobacteriota bacterium]
MIDPDIVGKKLEPFVFEHTWKDVVLYALGIGAQIDELPFLYENHPEGLKVFPSFGTILSGHFFFKALVPLKINLARFIHGEHILTLHRSIPANARTRTEGGIVSMYDKGKAALITFQANTSTDDGEVLCTNEYVIYYQGGGGFGGDPGPKQEPMEYPEGVEPDFSVSYLIPENQAVLYRLNGDINPLHIDPESAQSSGFENPIFHGLGTFGYATRAILYSLCEGDVERFKEIKVRFTGAVYPGETLVTEGWKQEEGRYLIQARTERGTVLSQAMTRIV